MSVNVFVLAQEIRRSKKPARLLRKGYWRARESTASAPNHLPANHTLGRQGLLILCKPCPDAASSRFAEGGNGE